MHFQQNRKKKRKLYNNILRAQTNAFQSEIKRHTTHNSDFQFLPVLWWKWIPAMKEVFHQNNSFGQVMVGSMLSNANLSDWEPAGGSPNNCLKPPAASLGDSTLLYLLIDFLSNFHADHFKRDLLKSELLPPIKIKSENLIHKIWYFRCGWKNAWDCLFFA